MEFIQLFTSFELSKRLAELGEKQESFHYWCPRVTKFINGVASYENWEILSYRLGSNPSYSAFTAPELGERLGSFSEVRMGESDEKFPGFMFINIKDMHHEYDANEANCRAKMRIYLLENKLVLP